MRKSYLTLLTALSLLFVFTIKGNSQDSKSVAPSIEWSSTTVDFGKIEYGKAVSADFEFVNKSMVPLLIISVQPTCGCTVADYPKEPVGPGQSAKISVTFNGVANGVFSKSILVSTNASEGYTPLLIKGEVNPQN